MDSRYRDLSGGNEPGLDYNRYQRASRNDHNFYTRNISDQFERDFQRERDPWNDDGRYRNQNTNPENNRHTGFEDPRRDFYNHNRREGHYYAEPADYRGNDRDRNSSEACGRDRYSGYGNRGDYRNEYRGGQDRYRNDHNRNTGYGSSRQAYGRSGYGNDYDQYAGSGSGDRQDFYPGSGGDDRRSRLADERSSIIRNDWYGPDRRSYLQERYY
ncbi:hypothetical protein CLV24_11564 [Pontibacter ummariensis]|uniref:Uncharacterized protein n=1 Tax=Pontibacter ummariensis TaxID=1610492 RepID=A0A239I081_9BACT|nr:hypothetical protein [Pontibacter ummariensis]PRY10147.1 hypothetical protein CLV24_11564 [Pontibacter ummariensis]SNS86901.1 hypothetical protein SAMN06296052_11564 [Pontibacter ummariensis]